MKRSSSPLAVVLCLSLFGAKTARADVMAASYFGGSGADVVTGVAIASDGSIVLSGTTTSASLAARPATVLGGTSGFVAKVDPTGTHILWLSLLGVTGKVKLTAADEPVVATGDTLTKVSSDGSSVVWTSSPLGNAVTAFDVAENGDIAVVAGTSARIVGGDGHTPALAPFDVGRSNPTGIALDPKTGDLFVSGDNNAGNCSGPWRSPFIFRYDRSGKKTWTFYDYSGTVACGDFHLAADSYFTNLRFDADGTLWVEGGADGGDTVLSKDPGNLAVDNPALQGACFPNACYGWKGAAKVGFAARFNAALTAFDRATFVVAHFAHAPLGCSCDTTDPGEAPRANSAGLALFATSTGEVVGAGSSAWHFPSVAPWYPAAAYTPGYPSVVTILDKGLSAMRMATMLPGTASMNAAAYRGGRLVVVGEAPDNSAWVAPADQVNFAQATIPATPNGSALQAAYGGGASDGFLYMACVTSDAECLGRPSGIADAGGADGAVPAVPGGDSGPPEAGAPSPVGDAGAVTAPPRRGSGCSLGEAIDVRGWASGGTLLAVVALGGWRRRARSSRAVRAC